MRLPGRDRLREIAASTRGSLDEVPYPVLLSAIALEKRSCLAVLRRRQTEKRLFFDRGVPVECLSNLLHETFGRFLVGIGKLSETEFSAAFSQANVSGLRLGEVLVARGTLPHDEVLRLLQQNLARKLLDGFTWHDGTFELVPDPPAIDSPPKVRAAQLIFTGVSKFAPQAAIDAAVGELVGKRLALHPAPPFPLGEIHLTEGQARVAAALEKRPRIDELAVAAALPFEEITRVLYALWILGAVVPAEQVPAPPALRLLRPEAPPSAPPSASPHARVEPSATPPAAAPPPVSLAAPDHGLRRIAPDAEPERRREELRIAHEAQRGLDAYDLLGLADGAGESDVVNSFVEKARTWAPWTFEGSRQDESHALSLFLAAARAYAELADPKSREILRKNRRITGQAVKSPAQFFAVRTDVLDPESQHRKGIEHFEAGRYSQALPFLEMAADCDPQNGSYAADAAWCRYHASGRTDASRTLGEMQEAYRIDPRAGVALYYAGEIAAARKDVNLAEVYFRKAAKLMGGDRRPLDALRRHSRSAAR